MRLRSHLSAGLAAAVAIVGSVFGCVGEDAAISNVGADAATESATADGGPGADGATESGVDPGPACSSTLPFRDDFERSDLKGCWDGLTKTGVLAATSKGELGMDLASAGHGFRVTLLPPDGGAAGGAVYLAKKLETPAPAPARLSFKWVAETFPVGTSGDGSSGLFAVELTYTYKDQNLFGQVGKVSVAFGLNDKSLNPYLYGGQFTPVDQFEAGGVFESALELTATQIKLSSKDTGTERFLALPTGTDFAVTGIKIGVPDVGSISDGWTLYFDDVLLETK